MVKSRLFESGGFTCSAPVPEPESAEYGACGFTVDGRSVRFRVGKTTPTKVGQFVTVWQRRADGPIRPFDRSDGVALFVISTRTEGHFGQFVFPCQALCSKDIVSVDGSGGKRGFRCYPPWVETTNRQAHAAQAWQLEFFLHLPENGRVDIARARQLYTQT
ncbi:MepB family protein [Nocardia australiensis]|uniref:MepB family protein n=1 Tax=Nocardia australiensis TaxID=2887191 RepID=UPI001D153A4D|nr:MepB family protein [Nocardia australiensis]